MLINSGFILNKQSEGAFYEMLLQASGFIIDRPPQGKSSCNLEALHPPANGHQI